MSKFNIVDSISFIENICFELMHQEDRKITIGSQTFECNEVNDNLMLLTTMMKFVIHKKVEKDGGE